MQNVIPITSLTPTLSEVAVALDTSRADILDIVRQESVPVVESRIHVGYVGKIVSAVKFNRDYDAYYERGMV